MFALEDYLPAERYNAIMLFDNLDECLDAAREQNGEMYSLTNLVRGQYNSKKPAKRQKTHNPRPVVFVRFNTRASGKPKPVTLKALVDSGGSGCLVAKQHVRKLKLKTSTDSTTWTTPSGSMTTTAKVKTQFCIPELHDDRLIEWDMHVTKSLGNYDMIIGRDLLNNLKIDISFSTQSIDWEGASVPFRD